MSAAFSVTIRAGCAKIDANRFRPVEPRVGEVDVEVQVVVTRCHTSGSRCAEALGATTRTAASAVARRAMSENRRMVPLSVNAPSALSQSGGRRVLLVGGGPVAAAKLQQLLAAGAEVHVVAPAVVDEIERTSASCGVVIDRRPFAAADLDGAWLVVAAATPR